MYYITTSSQLNKSVTMAAQYEYVMIHQKKFKIND